MAYTIKRTLLCGLAVFGLSLGLAACKGDNVQQAMQKPAPAVGVVELKARPIILYSEMPGRTVAYETAEVRPEVTGIIRERVYKEGSYVNKGDILYHIDDELYKASYNSAKANLAKAEAAANLAHVKERRSAELRKKNAISQQDYDDARATYLQATAEVEAAKAALQSAKINLDRTEIAAPISGLISKSTVSVGTLVSTNQVNALTTIYQINPMNVDLTESVETLVKARENAAKNMGKNSVNDNSGNLSNIDVPVKLILSDGRNYPQLGKLEFVDIGIDTGTSTVTMRASFPNEKYALMPGLFVRAKVQIGVESHALLIPQKAVLRDNRGNAYVFVAEGYTHDQEPSEQAPVKAKSKRRYIQVGDVYGENWLVLDGLKDGESIILQGIQKVTDDADVNVIMSGDINVPADADYLVENTKNNSKNNEIAEIQNIGNNQDNPANGGNA